MNEERVVPEVADVLKGKVQLVPHDEDASSEYPVLMSVLLPRYRGDGKLTREPGVLSVRIDGAVFRITVVCPTEGLQATVETPRIMEILTTIELAVSSPACVWVPTWDSKKRARRGLDTSV